MATSNVGVVRRTWAAVSLAEIDVLRDLLAPDVRWYDADEAGGGCRGRDEALALIEQTLEEGVTAEATDVRDAGTRVIAIVQTHHPDAWGEQPAPHGEVFTVQDGRIVEIVVYPDVDSALAAVRQPPSALDEMGSATAAGPPKVELLYFEGCPGHERLLPVAERLAARAGADFRMRTVETLEAAQAERFLGSPTLRVDGEDVEPSADARTDFGLKCRIYRSDEGQSGVPPEAWIHAALARAGAASLPHPAPRRRPR